MGAHNEALKLFSLHRCATRGCWYISWNIPWCIWCREHVSLNSCSCFIILMAPDLRLFWVFRVKSLFYDGNVIICCYSFIQVISRYEMITFTYIITLIKYVHIDPAILWTQWLVVNGFLILSVSQKYTLINFQSKSDTVVLLKNLINIFYYYCLHKMGSLSLNSVHSFSWNALRQIEG